MSNAKPKLVYILPFYDEGTDTHLFYNYKLIKESAGHAEIFVIVEKADITLFDDRKKVSYALGAPVYVQKFKFPPLRFLEMLFKCFVLQASGYRNFYIHYSYYGALAAWLVGGKTFYWNRGMPWLYKRGRFEEKIFRFILRRTILVTGPESLAKEYQKLYGVKEYRILSNWVDVDRFRSPSSPQHHILQDTNIRVLANFSARPAAGGAAQGLSKHDAESREGLANQRIVLFVHHLSRRKGADLVPEIAKGFGGDVLFLMIGEGQEREALKLQITNSNSQTNVEILGKIPNSELPQYFRAADVFLMPSREEGSPHVLLEAMASGTPFVASDVGGVCELVPQGLEQFLCKSEDVKCFQSKIKTLLADKALYDQASTACSAHAKNFDILRGVREFIALFK